MNDVMDRIKGFGIALALAFLTMAVMTLIFSVFGHPVAAAVSGTLTVCSMLAVSHIGSFIFGAMYTKGTVSMGADVALRAQESHERWNERTTRSLTNSVIEGVRQGSMIMRQEQSQSPILPPSQMLDGGWAPSVSALLDEVDGEARWRE